MALAEQPHITITLEKAYSVIQRNPLTNSRGQTKLDIFNQVFSDEAMQATSVERFGRTITEAFSNLSPEDIQILREDGIRRLALANIWEIEAALFHNLLSYANIEKRDRRA